MTIPSDCARIGISYVDPMPDELLEPFIADITDPRVELVRIPRPNDQMFAAVEWYIPTAIFVYLTKGYLDGFLQAAGADHYRRLRPALTKLMKRMSFIEVTYFGSGRKVKEDNPFTGAISVMADGRDGEALKLLFRKDADEDEIARSISFFLDFLEAYDKDCQADEIVEDFGRYRLVGRLHLLYYDKTLGKLREQNPQG